MTATEYAKFCTATIKLIGGSIAEDGISWTEELPYESSADSSDVDLWAAVCMRLAGAVQDGLHRCRLDGEFKVTVSALGMMTQVCPAPSFCKNPTILTDQDIKKMLSPNVIGFCSKIRDNYGLR